MCRSTYTFFWVMQILCIDQKIKKTLKTFCNRNTTSPKIESTTFVSPNCRWHHCATGVLSTWQFCEILLYIEATDYRSNFCKNDSVRKLILFFENTFQFLGGISQDVSVSHFDSRRSLSSANWRRSTSTILFVSFTHSCDQHDRKIRMIRKSAAWWRGRRARDYRKLILRANLLYALYIKM